MDLDAHSSKVLVFIPTLNDFEQLESITNELRALDFKITVMILDDGSTVPVNSVSKRDCLHFRLPTNFGLGVCTHIAFDHALRENYQAVVRIDADGQHPIAMIPALLEKLAANEADVIVASRNNRDQGKGWRMAFSRIVRGYFSMMARLLTNGMVPSDVNSGFFAANLAAVRVLNTCRLERFPEAQMYILACRRGLRVSKVPVEQMSRVHGASTITLYHALQIFYRFNIFVLSELLNRRGA